MGVTLRFRRPILCPACRVALVMLLLLSGTSLVGQPGAALGPGCGVHVTMVTRQPPVELSPSTPQIVAVARFTCTTARVRTVQLCVTPTIAAGTCATMTTHAQRGVLTARGVLSAAVGDRWIATARVDDPLLGPRQADAVLIAEMSAGCVPGKGVAAMT